jgi:fatty-acid desaturase
LLEKVFEVKKIIELVLRMINAVINTVEKVCNVLSWADPRRSLVIFLLLVLIACVASSYLFRGIGIVFCLHRLWKGESFYRIKHYNNNRKLAIYALRYIVNKAFPHLLPNKAKRI